MPTTDQTYRVSFRYRITTGLGVSTQDVLLRKDVTLPFPPYPGLWVSTGDAFQQQITDVVYDAADGSFDCDCGARNVWDRFGWNGGASLDDIRAVLLEWLPEALNNGWEIDGLGMLDGHWDR